MREHIIIDGYFSLEKYLTKTSSADGIENGEVFSLKTVTKSVGDIKAAVLDASGFTLEQHFQPILAVTIAACMLIKNHNGTASMSLTPDWFEHNNPKSASNSNHFTGAQLQKANT